MHSSNFLAIGMPLAAAAARAARVARGLLTQDQESENVTSSAARAVILSFSIAAIAVPALAAEGKVVYEKTCALCHASGVANAPRFGDKAAWAPRLAAGKTVLVNSVVKGKGAMPPRAGASRLTRAEISAAVDYIMAASR